MRACASAEAAYRGNTTASRWSLSLLLSEQLRGRRLRCGPVRVEPSLAPPQHQDVSCVRLAHVYYIVVDTVLTLWCAMLLEATSHSSSRPGHKSTEPCARRLPLTTYACFRPQAAASADAAARQVTTEGPCCRRPAGWLLVKAQRITLRWHCTPLRTHQAGMAPAAAACMRKQQGTSHGRFRRQMNEFVPHERTSLPVCHSEQVSPCGARARLTARRV